MNFELTSEQQALQKAAIDFGRRELNSNMIERDAQQVFSHEGWKKCAAFGVQGMSMPKRVRRAGCRRDHYDRDYGRPGLWRLRSGIALFYQCPYVDQFDPATQIRHRTAKEEVPAGLVRWKSHRG